MHLPFINEWPLCLKMQEITKDDATGLLTLHTLKDKKEKVTLTGYDCVLLAIGRVPNTDTLGLESLVSYCAVLINAVS